MRVGIIGCGYVFDTYMQTFRRHPHLELAGIFDIDTPRAQKVAAHYGLKLFASREDLLADASIELIINLTSIDAHYEVTKAAILAGKHVYSEKPFTTELDRARELIALAEKAGVRISGAPCNAMSPTVQTMWRWIDAGAVGKVRVVYAEFDDNPIYLMKPEDWRSPTGAPWPYKHEYEAGCTFEHAGYYLSWLCAMFGPAETITRFSSCRVPDKTATPLDPPNTPDLSVGCITFRSGVVARFTCSIVGTFDQRFRVIGDEGELSANTYRDYHCPVRLERFSDLTLNARKARWVRENSLLQGLLGVGGRKVPLVEPATHCLNRMSWKSPVGSMKRHQLGAQDKCMGVAEMASAIESGQAPWLAPDFILHVTELTLALQAGGSDSETYRLTSDFQPLRPRPAKQDNQPIRVDRSPSLAARIAEPLIARLHKH